MFSQGSEAVTPLLGRFMMLATWENVREHAAGAFNYWGSRGRGFESRRPDFERVFAGHRLAKALFGLVNLDVVSGKAFLDPLTRGLSFNICLRTQVVRGFWPRRGRVFGV
jgi:hypothetical protein